MNAKEMETLIIAQGDELQTAETSIKWLRSAVDQLQDVLAARDVVIQTLTARVEELAKEFTTELHDMDSRVSKIETLVLARNASAATKRNMTDEDALRVLTGDLRELSHKDAAEKIALTYAQVYSCRLEFTFKHVHKDLRDNVKEWKNPWGK